MGKEEGSSADSGKRILRGMPLDFCGMAWDRANEYIKNKPNLVAIADLDSGYPQIMTKEQAKQLSDLWESCCPKSNIKIDSKLFFFGTGGGIENNKSFEELFNNPNND